MSENVKVKPGQIWDVHGYGFRVVEVAEKTAKLDPIKLELGKNSVYFWLLDGDWFPKKDHWWSLIEDVP